MTTTLYVMRRIGIRSQMLQLHFSAKNMTRNDVVFLRRWNIQRPSCDDWSSIRLILPVLKLDWLAQAI